MPAAVVFVLALGLCAAPQPGVQAPAPPPAQDPEPAVAPVDPAALLEAGACRDESETIAQVTSHDVGGTEILEVTCQWYAYQPSVELWFRDGDTLGRVQDGAGSIAGAGLITVHPEGRIELFEKAAGSGHCGDYTVWQLTGTTANVVERRSRSCDAPIPEGGEVPPPAEWARVL